MTHSFGSDWQNNRCAQSSPQLHQNAARIPLYTDVLRQHLVHLENVTCAKINARTDEISKIRSFRIRGRWSRSRIFTPIDLRSRSRQWNAVMGRHMIWWLLYNSETWAGKFSCLKLGRMYGRDHTTVLHGIRKIDFCLVDRPQSIESEILISLIPAAERVDMKAFQPTKTMERVYYLFETHGRNTFEIARLLRIKESEALEYVAVMREYVAHKRELSKRSSGKQARAALVRAN